MYHEWINRPSHKESVRNYKGRALQCNSRGAQPLRRARPVTSFRFFPEKRKFTRDLESWKGGKQFFQSLRELILLYCQESWHCSTFRFPNSRRELPSHWELWKNIGKMRNRQLSAAFRRLFAADRLARAEMRPRLRGIADAGCLPACPPQHVADPHKAFLIELWDVKIRFFSRVN